jgi:hypothetical protein
MEPAADGPADDAPSKEVNDDGKVEPALACPDIGDVGTPFLVRPRCVEVLDSRGLARPERRAGCRSFV